VPVDTAGSREDLLALVAEQAVVIAEQGDAIDQVVAQYEIVVARNEALVAEVSELKRRLGLNSSNSSKPPSSDGLAKPPPRSQRRASGRRPGKQRGAPGAALQQVGDPDEVVEHRPAVCRGCRGGLCDAEVVSVARRQVFELPEIRRRVIEHRLLSCRCACGTVSAPAAPPGVRAPVQYGPGVIAVAVYLLVAQHLPVKRVAQLMADLLGSMVSTGWLDTCLSRASTSLTGFRDRLHDALGQAGVVHFDETGSRVAGGLMWTHVACTSLLTCYHLDAKRGQTAIDAHAILPALIKPQIALHDGWMPYFKGCYSGVEHALCNAHHLRELDGWAEHDPSRHTWAAGLADLLREGNTLVTQAKINNEEGLPPDTLADLHHRWTKAVEAAYTANPPPSGKRRGPVRALIDRLRGGVTEIWRFAHDFTVPFDNNQAERDIRMIKVQTKVSGGWRTTDGARHWLHVREYISTAAKHGVHILTALHDAILGDPWLPPLPE
jgi:transposase